jgi:hypothetical protein
MLTIGRNTLDLRLKRPEQAGASREIIAWYFFLSFK